MRKFVISLPNSLVRRELVKKMLHDIDFEFFDAVDLSIDKKSFIYDFYDKNKTKKYKGYELTKAELGCFASHIKLWEYCIASNEVILIMEDNLELKGSLLNHMGNIEYLTNKYGILKLSNIFEGKYYYINGIDDKYSLISYYKGACGTTAYCISPKVASRYLALVKGFFEPVDDFMDNEWRTKVTLFSYYPSLICRSKIKSVIGKRKIKAKIKISHRIIKEFYRIWRRLNQKIYNYYHKKK